LLLKVAICWCFDYRRVEVLIIVVFIEVVIEIVVNVGLIVHVIIATIWCVTVIITITEIFITTDITVRIRVTIRVTIRVSIIPPLHLLNQLYQTHLQPITTTISTTTTIIITTNNITTTTSNIIIAIIAITPIQMTILPQHFHLHILINYLLIHEINKLALLLQSISDLFYLVLLQRQLVLQVS